MNSQAIKNTLFFLLIIGFLGNIIFYFDLISTNFLLTFIGVIGQVAAALLIINEGKTVKSKKKVIQLFVFGVIAVIGMGFKMADFPGADILLLLGMGGVLISYNVFLIKRKKRVLLDYFKLIWSNFFILSRLFILLHIPTGNELKLVEGALFIGLFVVYSRKKLANEKGLGTKD